MPVSCVTFPPMVEKKWWYCDQCDRASAEGILDAKSGLFVEIKMTCPNESVETIAMQDDWPQSESGLLQMLPSLCRDYCS